MKRSRILAVIAMVALGCALQPLDRVDPRSTQLRSTRARTLGGTWSNMTGFCLAQDGSTTRIHTVYSSGDPDLDELYREAVAKWTYKPTRSESERCLQVRFDEDFGPERRPGLDEEPPETKNSTPWLKAIRNPPPPMWMLVEVAKEKKILNWTMVTRTAFCIQRDGTVDKVETLRSTGVEKLDMIARATVVSWRFEPFPPEVSAPCLSTEVSFKFNF